MERCSRNRAARAPDQVQSSHSCECNSLVPAGRLGPPRMTGSMCRTIRPVLDLAVCIPSEQIFRSPSLKLRRPPHQPFAAHSKVSDVFEISQMRTTSVSRGFEGVGYDFCARLILLGVSGVGAGIECANVRADHKHSASAPGLGSRGARPE